MEQLILDNFKRYDAKHGEYEDELKNMKMAMDRVNSTLGGKY